MFNQVGAVMAVALIIIFFVMILSGKSNFTRLIIVCGLWVSVIWIFGLDQYLPNLLKILDIAMGR